MEPSKSEFFLPDSLLPPTNAPVETHIINSAIFAGDDILPLIGSPSNAGYSLYSQFFMNELSLATFGTSFVCDNCTFDSNYASHNQLLTSVLYGGYIYTNPSYSVETSNDGANLYRWDSQVSVFYDVANVPKSVELPSTLYLRAAYVQTANSQSIDVIPCPTLAVCSQ